MASKWVVQQMVLIYITLFHSVDLSYAPFLSGNFCAHMTRQSSARSHRPLQHKELDKTNKFLCARSGLLPGCWKCTVSHRNMHRQPKIEHFFAFCDLNFDLWHWFSKLTEIGSRWITVPNIRRRSQIIYFQCYPGIVWIHSHTPVRLLSLDYTVLYKMF